jgi:predicted RNA binding protein YcfA (HicA-like mRNA interferase family)
LTIPNIFGIINLIKDKKMPRSGKEMVKLFKKKGFVEVKGQGKGSHMKLRKNNITIIIPAHKELKKGLERALLKQLQGV